MAPFAERCGQMPISNTHFGASHSCRSLLVCSNLWVNLKSVKELIAADAIHSPVLVNERILNGTRILELETAAGAAIEVRQRESFCL